MKGRLRSIKSKRYILHLVDELPIPPAGKVEMAFPIGNLILYCSRPAVNDFPIMVNVITFIYLLKFSFYPLFYSLSLDHIIMFLEFILMERKIIVISSYSNILTYACEAILALCFPFTWDHIYIPILPARLLSYLQAPVPFLVGLNREYFNTPLERENRPSDAVLIDLDKDSIVFTGPSLCLPSRERRKLISRIQKCIPTKSSNTIEAMTTFSQTFPMGKHVSICSSSSRVDSSYNSFNQSLNPTQPALAKKQSTLVDILDFQEFKKGHSDTKSINSVSSEPISTNLGRKEVFVELFYISH